MPADSRAPSPPPPPPRPTDRPAAPAPPGAPRVDAAAFVAACVLLATAAAYLLVTAAHLPLPQYVPLEHRWVVQVPPGAIGMDWFARAAATALAGALAVPAARALAARSAWARSPRAARLAFGLAFGALGWAALYTVLALASTPRGRAAAEAEEPPVHDLVPR